jgi:type II secretory pathway pseudopilin PulG
MDRRAVPRRRSVPRRDAAGFTLLDVTFALGVIGLIGAIAIPRMHDGVDRSRGLAAARYLASRMALARALAISRSANVALRFDEGSNGIGFAMFVDGNGNGVRSADIAARVDPSVEPPVLLGDIFPGVAIALSADVAPGDAVQVGSSSLLSFTASGTATSGSVYVRGRDGTQWAVRVLGTTARTRVLRYSPSTGGWVQAF